MQSKRGKDLKLVVMSATLDAAKFVNYFPGSKAAYLQACSHAPLSLRSPLLQTTGDLVC
jgi:HrpA-like RNA helicase